MLNRYWATPSGEYPVLFEDMLSQNHLLIAGVTGSGKSVLINGLMYTALLKSPNDVRFILIDPKRVELRDYRDMPHTLAHAAGFDPKAWNDALTQAVATMDRRYAEMERRRERLYKGSDVYVVIDEWANVYKNGGKQAYRSVLRLISEGRAARVHVLMATQVPKASIIPTEIRDNFSARVCLHTNSAMESRVIMERKGCENLPAYGYGYYLKPCYLELWNIPMIDERERQRVLEHWTQHNKPKIKWF